MRNRVSTLSILTFSIFISCLVQLTTSSVLDLFESHSFSLPQPHPESKPRSLGTRDNATWPSFPFTTTVVQNSSTPEWLQFTYGGQSGTYQQNMILSSLISNLSATFAMSLTDTLSNMSSIGSQDVYLLFSIHPRSLNAQSFASALRKLASYLQQWGAKEMDFAIGSGLQNSTAEGVFQVRLGLNSSTAGTGISSSIPFTSLTVPSIAAINASSAPVVTATSASFGLPSWNNSAAVHRSTNAIVGSSTPVAYPNRTASTSATQSMSQSTVQLPRLNSSSMPASTVASHSIVLSAGNNSATSSQSHPALFASRGAALTAGNSTGYHSQRFATSRSNNATLSSLSTLGSSASSVYGSSVMSVMSTGCSAGYCSAGLNSSRSLGFTLTSSTLPSSSTIAGKQFVGNAGQANGISLDRSSTSPNLPSNATISTPPSSGPLAPSTPVSSSLGSFTPTSSASSSTQSSISPGSTRSSNMVAQSSSNTIQLVTTSTLLPGPLSSTSGTATVTGQSSVVDLLPLEQSVEAQGGHGSRANNFNGLCPGLVCPVCPGCAAGAAAGEYPGPAAGAPLALGDGNPGDTDPEDSDDQNQSQTADNVSRTQASGSQAATLTSSSFAQASSTAPLSSSMVSHTISSNGSMTSQAPSSTCSACAVCQGFQFSSAFPVSNSTNVTDNYYEAVDDDGDEGDWVDQKRGLVSRGILGRDFTGQADTGKALAGRFFHEDWKSPLFKRKGSNANVKTHLGACQVTPFTAKPKYPAATGVSKFEGPLGELRAGAELYAPFFATATYWAVPSIYPKGDCRVPDWGWKTTDELATTFDNDGKKWIVGGKGGDTNHVNIDHVYETHFLTEFFEDLLSPGGGLGLQQFTCEDVENQLDITDAQDPQGGTRLNTIFSMLASFTHPEFIGMDEEMNLLKAEITHADPFLPNHPLPFAGTDPRTGLALDPATDMANLARICIVLDMLNTPKAVQLFSMTHGRIYEALTLLTDLPERGGFFFNQSPHGSDLGYIVYMAERFEARNKELQSIYNSVVGSLPTKQLAFWDEFKSSFTSRYPVASMTLPIEDLGYYCPEDIKIGKRDGACQTPTNYQADYRLTNPGWSSGTVPTGSRTLGSKGAFSNIGDLNGVPLPTSTSTGSYPISSPAITSPPSTGTISATSLTSSAIPRNVTTPIISSSPPIHSSTPDASSSASSSGSAVSIPLVSSPLSLSTSKPSASSSAPLVASSSANPDPCGPAIQQPAADYSNTCNAAVKLVQTPSNFGVLCQEDATLTTATAYGDCATVYNSFCQKLGSGSWTDTDKWVWQSETGCAIGIYVPGGSGNAQIPSASQCRTKIFNAMVDSCEGTPGNIASVNVAQWPSFTDGTQVGQQFNNGYPMYMIAPEQPQG